MHDRLITCQKLVSDPIEKNKFSTPAKPRPNGTSDKSNTIIKVAQFNKLRSAVLLRPRICTTLFQMEFTELPECLTMKGIMYHGEKSNMLNVFKDPLPSAISTLKARSVVMAFREFSEDVIKCLKHVSLGCFRLYIVCDSYFEISLKGQTRLADMDSSWHFLQILYYLKTSKMIS